MDPTLILAALLGAIIWDLITWWLGLPTSSSHALLGGLGGAAIAKAGFGALILSGWVKPILFIVISPLLGHGAGARPHRDACRGCCDTGVPGPLDRVVPAASARFPRRSTR